MSEIPRRDAATPLRLTRRCKRLESGEVPSLPRASESVSAHRLTHASSSALDLAGWARRVATEFRFSPRARATSPAVEPGFVPDRCTRGRNRDKGGATRTPACDHRRKNEPDPERSSFEDVARALAEEVSGAIERLSEIDLDEIARAASAEGERARQWIDDLGRWLREQTGAWEHGPARADRSTPGRPTGDDPLRHAGPHPLDLPTPDQGVALAALDSGRWRVEPGTSALAVHGEGPAPATRWASSASCEFVTG